MQPFIVQGKIHTHKHVHARTHSQKQAGFQASSRQGRYLSRQFWMVPCGRAQLVAAWWKRAFMWCKHRKSDSDVMRLRSNCPISDSVSCWYNIVPSLTVTPSINLESMCVCGCMLVCVCDELLGHAPLTFYRMLMVFIAIAAGGEAGIAVCV